MNINEYTINKLNFSLRKSNFILKYTQLDSDIKFLKKTLQKMHKKNKQ